MKTIDRIMEYLKYKDIAPTKFERLIGLSNGYLGKTLKRKADVGSSILKNIIDNSPDLNPEWLLTGQGSMLRESVMPGQVNDFSTPYDARREKQQVPLYDTEATAGIIPLAGNGSANVTDYIQIPNLPLCDGAVRAIGNSMYPLVQPGDIVLYKSITDMQNNIFYGEMYLLNIDMEGDIYVTVKYVHKSTEKGKIKLVSYNKEFDDQDVPIAQIKAMAMVKATIRFNSIK